MHKTQSLINCLICSETCKAAACPRHTPFSPHLCVGFLFLILYPAPPPCPPPSPPPRCHTHNFVTHHLSHTTLSHTSLSHNIFHTQLCHTPLCHTPSFTNNFVTHLFVTHLFSSSHTIFHTQLRHTPLCHTPSFTHSFDTALSHTTFHKPLCHTHTILSHAIFHIPLSLCHTQLCHTPSLHGRPGHTPSLRGRRGKRGTWRHPPALCVAGVARMALGWVWWRAWGPLVARRATTLCVAGHLATCTYVLRGRRGAYGTGLGLAPFGCVACLHKLGSRHASPCSIARHVLAMFCGIAVPMDGAMSLAMFCKPFWHVLQRLGARHASPCVIASHVLGTVEKRGNGWCHVLSHVLQAMVDALYLRQFGTRTCHFAWYLLPAPSRSVCTLFRSVALLDMLFTKTEIEKCFWLKC